jgi:hypothetical protein
METITTIINLTSVVRTSEKLLVKVIFSDVGTVNLMDIIAVSHVDYLHVV